MCPSAVKETKINVTRFEYLTLRLTQRGWIKGKRDTAEGGNHKHIVSF